MFVILFINM